MELDVKPGDIILGGKFRNKPYVVKSFDVDDHNQPIIITDKGKKVKILCVRIKKLMKEDINFYLKKLINELKYKDKVFICLKKGVIQPATLIMTSGQTGRKYRVWHFKSKGVEYAIHSRWKLRISKDKDKLISRMNNPRFSDVFAGTIKPLRPGYFMSTVSGAGVVGDID